MKHEILVRDIRDDDIDQVISLWHKAGVSRPWNDPARDVTFASKGPHSTVLVGLDGKRIVTTAMVGEDGHRGWVYYVAVDPGSQRGGLGAIIMRAAEDWLVNRGIWKIQLLVRAGNSDAAAFYEKLGYHDTRSVCLQKVLKD